MRARSGVGYLTDSYWKTFAPEKRYAALVILMSLWVLLNWLLGWVEQLVMLWRREERTRSRRRVR